MFDDHPDHPEHGESARPIHDVPAAVEHVRSAALTSSPTGLVGLEVEQHVIDLSRPDRRADQARVAAAVAGPLPGGSRITFEPGGQIELSGPPHDGVLAAVQAMQGDLDALGVRLAGEGLSGVLCGTDAQRNPVRINDTQRYTAMADYFLGAGFMGPASVMMCSTAALQVNLEAGPEEEWATRVSLAADLAPVIVALSACSPEVLGRSTGWVSSRMRNWFDLDPRRTMPMSFGDDPALEWATWAVNAPVMMVRESADGTCSPVRKGVSFGSWVTGEVLLGGRRPTWSDLDYHLTTVFPPLRLRGFLEIRTADSCPWWAAVAAVTVALLDDPEAADIARQAIKPVAGEIKLAAKKGLADEDIAEAALTCVRAARHALPRLGAEALTEDLRDLEARVLSGGG